MSRRTGSGEAARVFRSSSRIQAELAGDCGLRIADCGLEGGGDLGFGIWDLGLVGALGPSGAGGTPRRAFPTAPGSAGASPSLTATRRRVRCWRTRGILIWGMSSMDLRALRGTSGSMAYQYISGR